ncbi:hypothetical protein ACVWXU_002408 [Streptomyces sp. TE33382]
MDQERHRPTTRPATRPTVGTWTKQALTGKDAAPGAVGRSGTAR